MAEQYIERYTITITDGARANRHALIYGETGTKFESIMVSTLAHVEEFKDRIKGRLINEFQIRIVNSHGYDDVINAVYDAIGTDERSHRMTIGSLVCLKENIKKLRCNIIKFDRIISGQVDFERTLIANDNIKTIEINSDRMIEQLYITIINKKNLHRLSIMRTILDADMRLLVDAVSKSNISALVFNNCRIFRDHFDTLCNAVKLLPIKTLIIDEDDSNDTTQQHVDIFVDALKYNYTLTYIRVSSWRINVDPLAGITSRNRKLELKYVLAALTNVCVAFKHLLEYPYVLLEIFDWTNPHYHMFWHVDKIKLIFRIKQSVEKIMLMRTMFFTYA